MSAERVVSFEPCRKKGYFRRVKTVPLDRLEPERFGWTVLAGKKRPVLTDMTDAVIADGNTAYYGVDFGKSPVYFLVYTLYGYNGEVLYVGKTHNPAYRFSMHERKDYWEEVAYVGIRRYGNILEMSVAELLVANALYPKHNKRGSVAGIGPLGYVSAELECDASVISYCSEYGDSRMLIVSNETETVFSKTLWMQILFCRDLVDGAETVVWKRALRASYRMKEKR